MLAVRPRGSEARQLAEARTVIRVYDHKWKRVRTLKREHVCRRGKGGCLRVTYMFGLPFAWCARYSYAGDPS